MSERDFGAEMRKNIGRSPETVEIDEETKKVNRICSEIERARELGIEAGLIKAYQRFMEDSLHWILSRAVEQGESSVSDVINISLFKLESMVPYVMTRPGNPLNFSRENHEWHYSLPQRLFDHSDSCTEITSQAAQKYNVRIEVRAQYWRTFSPEKHTSYAAVGGNSGSSLSRWNFPGITLTIYVTPPPAPDSGLGVRE